MFQQTSCSFDWNLNNATLRGKHSDCDAIEKHLDISSRRLRMHPSQFPIRKLLLQFRYVLIRSYVCTSIVRTKLILFLNIYIIFTTKIMQTLSALPLVGLL